MNNGGGVYDAVVQTFHFAREEAPNHQTIKIRISLGTMAYDDTFVSGVDHTSRDMVTALLEALTKISKSSPGIWTVKEHDLAVELFHRDGLVERRSEGESQPLYYTSQVIFQRHLQSNRPLDLRLTVEGCMRARRKLGTFRLEDFPKVRIVQTAMFVERVKSEGTVLGTLDYTINKVSPKHTKKTDCIDKPCRYEIDLVVNPNLHIQSESSRRTTTEKQFAQFVIERCGCLLGSYRKTTSCAQGRESIVALPKLRLQTLPTEEAVAR